MITNGSLLSVVNLRLSAIAGPAHLEVNGMNWELIKHKICRLIATSAILLGGAMVSAAAAGSMPLWAVVLGLFAVIVLLNAVCGILLDTPAESHRAAAPAARKHPAVQLRVVRGGHAA